MNETLHQRPVVVGIDGTAVSRAALVFALEEGAARHATVEVVSVWSFGSLMHDAPAHDTASAEARETRSLQDAAIAEALAYVEARPAISQIVVHGESGPALVEAANDASMLVVGSGRKGSLARFMIGSTSDYCARHSAVPVVIVPDPVLVHVEPGGAVEARLHAD